MLTLFVSVVVYSAPLTGGRPKVSAPDRYPAMFLCLAIAVTLFGAAGMLFVCRLKSKARQLQPNHDTIILN